MDLTEQPDAARKLRLEPLASNNLFIRPGDNPAMPAIATPATMDKVIESLHFGGLLALTMQLARQRASERATPGPPPIGKPGITRFVA
jgi:hypothetical protein